jgi:hypothetical protein
MSEVKDLTVNELEDYKNHARNMNGFFDLMYEYFELSYDTYKGYTAAEIRAEVEELYDQDKKKFLRELKFRGEGRSKIIQTSNSGLASRRYSKMFAVYAQRQNDPTKYDMIFVRVNQIKEIDVSKLSACILGSTAAGIALGLALGPVGWAVIGTKAAIGVGAAVAGGGLAATAAKSNSELTNMPDVITGYIVNQLEQKRILSIANQAVYLTL